MPFNTRNPIPSGDLRDLDDNARNIDTWANDKTKLSHPDRFGVERRTWHGIEQEAKLNIQQAIDAKNAAQEAAMMSGFSKYADTLAQLEAGIGTDYVDGDVVMVFQDESRGDTSSIFKIESGAAEFKITFDKTRQDLLSFTGNISADAEWSDVPSHTNSAFDTQVSPIVGNLETLRYASQTEVYDILITYGQSNAVGFAAGEGSSPSTLEGRGPITELGFYWDGSAVSPLIYDMVQSSGEKSTGNAWVPFANEYCRTTGRRLVVIPCAKGATTISQLQKGGEWYTRMQQYVDNCVNWLNLSGKTIGKRWLGFHQGEADQRARTPEASYANDLVILKNNCVSDFSLDKFIIHYVGYPENRPEDTWDYIINVQRRLTRTHKDVVCGFDACASFRKVNGLVNSDGVHYNQFGFNIMGSTSGKVAAGLVINDKSQDLNGDLGYAGLKFPKDRMWFFISASVFNDGAAWKIGDRAKPASPTQAAVSNSFSITASSGNRLSLTTATPVNSFLINPHASLPISLTSLGYKASCGFDEVGDLRIAVHCDLSFVVSSSGVISTHSGSALNPILAQLVSASYSASNNEWDVSVDGNMVGTAIVTPFGVGSNAVLKRGGGSSLKVHCPSSDSNKAFCVRIENLEVNFTKYSNIGPIHVSSVAGQASW